MERPIGSKFMVKGCVYVVIEDEPYAPYGACDKCAFVGGICGDYVSVTGSCGSEFRKDRKSVHFEHFGVDF